MKNLFLLCLTLFAIVFLLSCEKEVSISPKTEPVPIASIIIESNPPNAKIYEEGKNTGLHSPDTLGWLEERKYEFTLKLPLYRDSVFIINVVKDQELKLDIDFNTNLKMMGNINCITDPPGAAIYLDDVNTGLVTPSVIKSLIPGEYKITFEKASCRADSTFPIVESSTETHAFINMIDTTFIVDYRSTSSGLSEDYFSQIIFDDNKLWISSVSALHKFISPQNVVNIPYESTPLGDANIIKKMTIGADGNLYLASLRGLFRTDGVIWDEFYDNDRSFPQDFVNDLELDRDGKLWLATKEGVFYLEDDRFLNISEILPELQKTDVKAVDIDARNYTWFALSDTLLIQYRNGGFVRWHQSTVAWKSGKDLPFENMKQITHSETEVWFVYKYGLLRYGYTTGKWRAFFFNYPENSISKIYIDKDDRTWVCTKNFGLITFTNSPDVHTRYDTENSELPTNDIRDCVMDANGDLWLTTYGHGIIKLKLNQK